MKRDIDLIRAIVLATLETPMGLPLNGIPGVDMPTFAAHSQWLHEAGLVHAALSPKDSPRHATQAIIFRLTWDGCEFADAVKNDTLWAKAKSKVLIPSASWTFAVLVDWLKTEITQSLPKIGL